MREIRLFVRLSAQERMLLLHATSTVAAARLALWLFPFRWVRRPASRRRAVSLPLAAIPIRRLSWAVRAAARRIPQASCLTQALALQHLLIRAGHGSEIWIGVAKDQLRGFDSHAWVHCRGEIVLGDDCELGRYAPILTLRASEI